MIFCSINDDKCIFDPYTGFKMSFELVNNMFIFLYLLIYFFFQFNTHTHRKFETDFGLHL